MPDERDDVLTVLQRTLSRLAADGLGSELGRRELVTHATRLRREAGHLPQAQRLAEALERCAHLPAPAAAVQLLKLLAAMQHLSSAEAALQSPSPEPEWTPLFPAPEGVHSSPLAPELLLELRAALARRVQPPAEVLKLLSRPEVGDDVRTWPLLEEGLAHPYLREAAIDALIRLGPVLAPRLRRRFNRRGDATDAARLQVLVAVEPSELTPLLLESARRGSAPVRRIALEALAEHPRLGPEDREAVVLEVYAACVESERPELAGALAKLGSDSALRHLWHLAATGAVSEVQLRGLLPTRHLARWLTLVDDAVPGFSQTADFFQLLEGWEDPQVRALLVERSEDPSPHIRRLAIEALLASVSPAELAALAERCLCDPDLNDVGVTTLYRLDAASAERLLGPRVEAWLLAHENGPTATPLPRWLQLAHHYAASGGFEHSGWWRQLDALRSARTAPLSGPPGPLQPASIRERKEG